MRRLALICAALAVAIPAAASHSAPPKTQTVTNPMAADLNGGGFAIYNTSGISTRSFAVVNDSGAVAVGAHADSTTDPRPRGELRLGDGAYPIYGYPTVTAGTANPSVQGRDLDAGSLYLRRVDPQHGELWFHVGDAPAAWICVAGCGP